MSAVSRRGSFSREKLRKDQKDKDGQEKVYELRKRPEGKDRRKQKQKSVGVQVATPCNRCASLTLQEADPKTIRDHRILSRVADTITTWDEITSLGLELSCNPNDVARLRNENRSIKGAAYEILRSFYTRHADSIDTMRTALKNALKELGKEALHPALGIEELKSDIT